MAKAFGVADLAKKLDLEQASVRVGLRNRGVKKNADGKYEWDQAGMAKIVEAWDKGSGKKSAPKKAAKKSDKKASAKKSAKKPIAKATVKKAAKKDSANDD